MKLGTNPMHAVQQRDKISTTFTTRRKQAHEHYDRFILVNRDPSHAAKKNNYQRLQEALREATCDYHMQKQGFESAFFSLLPRGLREDFDKVWRERTMEQGWVEADGGIAPTAMGEHLYYPMWRNMRSDYIQAVNRRFLLDTTNETTIADGAQMRLSPIHQVDPLMDPSVRTDLLTLRDIVALAKNKYYPQNKDSVGILVVIDQVYYEKMTLNRHVLPHIKDHYGMDDKFLSWGYLSDSPVVKN